MQLPEPLNREELERVWRWEKRTVRFHTVAIPLLMAAAGAVYLYGEAEWVRRAAMALVIVLVGAATVIQLSEKCPRCKARLRIKTIMRLPDRCHYCGVAFERPPA